MPTTDPTLTWYPTHLRATVRDVAERRDCVITAVRENGLVALLQRPLPERAAVHLEIQPRPVGPTLLAKGSVQAVRVPGDNQPLLGLIAAPVHGVEVELDDPSPEVRAMLAAQIEAHARRRRVVLVDDEPLQLALLQKIMETIGFDPICVSAPLGAVEVIAQAQPCLILLDINMPELNGRDLCVQLKANEATRHTPVLFLSGLPATEIAAAAEASGANGFIEKGADVNTIIAVVHEHLGG